MKKYLIFGIILIMASFATAANVSATSISSQSADVVVGEVDQIDIDNENPDADAPNTGLFGLGSDGVGTVVATMIPAIIVLVCIFWHIYRKRTK